MLIVRWLFQANEILRIREKMFDLCESPAPYVVRHDLLTELLRRRPLHAARRGARACSLEIRFVFSFHRTSAALEQLDTDPGPNFRSRMSSARMLDRDHYLVPSAAIEQGIIDQVLTKRPAEPDKQA